MVRWQVWLVAALVSSMLAACVSALAVERADAQGTGVPELLSPKNKQRIGEGEEDGCRAAPAACYRIRAEGRVPSGLTPFFGVEPIAESPKMWIQPEIRGIDKDGTFSGLVHLGEEHIGAKEYFKIYVLACRTTRFHNDEQIIEIPKDCAVSAAAEVYRVR
jgi:hypothetical protein